MCVFCAAIPTTLALGAATHGKQREAERKAAAEGQPAPAKPRLPVVPLTAAAVVLLATGSVIYHTRFPV